MIGRLVHTADFQRLLATPTRSRSAHFAVHHLSSAPSAPLRPAIHQSSTDLSTAGDAAGPAPVDSPPDGFWLGNVIPKRHARRAVTRNLVRRQIRAAMTQQLASLPPGLWLVRLRQPFDRRQFVSAASDRLREALRSELGPLFAQAAHRVRNTASAPAASTAPAPSADAVPTARRSGGPGGPSGAAGR